MWSPASSSSVVYKEKFRLRKPEDSALTIAIRITGFFIAFLGFSANLFAAQESFIKLEDMLTQALQRNPEILEAQAEWQAAKKRVWIDSALPDPVGEYDMMGEMRETRTGPEKNRFTISQEIPFPLKLWTKARMARQDAQAAFQRRQAVEWDIVNQLTKFYAELYWADASIQAIEEIKGLLKQFESVAEARYSNLAGSQRDVAKAQAEVSMILERLYMLKQQRESAAAKINAILNADPMSFVGRPEAPAMPVLKHSLIELVNLAVAHRPEIKEMEAMVSKAKHNKRLAQLANIPDLNVGFEYIRVGSGSTAEAPDVDGRDSWMFPIRINLPIWQNRIIPEIQEAKKKLEAGEARLLKTKNTAFYEVKEAYHRFESAAQIVRLYESAVIPQAKLALSADQAGYESGRADFLNLLDSGRVYLNAKLNNIQFLTEAVKSYADLARATGLDLDKSETRERQEVSP